MSDLSANGKEFIENVERIIGENISNEQFGVSELAEAINMSRSNLLRKIKKYTKLSASQFIRQVRLEKGMEMLKETTLTVSEVSFQVGFSSSSYFIKCFREHYGYPPGEVNKQEERVDTEQVDEIATEEKTQTIFLPYYKKYGIIAGVLLLSVISIFLIYTFSFHEKDIELEKSIAVLPFKNESDNPSNLYFINGLMESTLTKLQKVEDLRVISRTSAEQYRNSDKSIPEIGEELNVSYVVEGSSQRVEDQVLLSIQLIETSSDKPIWAEQYRHEIVDIFNLQNEVAKKIVEAIEVVVKPSELEQLEKQPTENLVAYDYYLQALDPFYTRTEENLKKAISLFEKAIEHDNQFSLAYAYIAISYYLQDLHKEKKLYTEKINNFSDKALLYDSKSAVSLVAKAMYYLEMKEYKLALPHLTKALEYNPNSPLAVNFLADFYFRYQPNTSKYLEYALKSMQLDIASNDSTTKSYQYLNLSNALIQNGFINEALQYINLSLAYDSNNYFSPYVKAMILYAKNQNLEETQRLLVQEWQKDTIRIDILQETAKFFYYNEDYDSAFYYYERYNVMREQRGLGVYPHEFGKISAVYMKKGLKTRATEYFKVFSQYCENEESIYKSASLAEKYMYEGKQNLAIEQLKIFAKSSNYQYWVLLFQDIDPVMKPLKSHPEYDEIIQKIKDNFWKSHEKLKHLLEEDKLL